MIIKTPNVLLEIIILIGQKQLKKLYDLIGKRRPEYVDELYQEQDEKRKHIDKVSINADAFLQIKEGILGWYKSKEDMIKIYIKHC